MREGRKIILAVGGASGAIYARLVAQRLIAIAESRPNYFSQVALVCSKQAVQIAEHEDRADWMENPLFTRYSNEDFFAGPASGSAGFDTMIVVPCSMGFVGRVASGVADSLMLRAADVMLKERARLVLVPRETPLSTIHTDSLARLSSAGVVICPASPSFYSQPKTIEELCDTVVERILKLCDVETPSYVWGQDNIK